MTKSCIASIDQGTSSSRVLIISSTGSILSSHQVEHTQHYPSSGYVEHDALEIWKNVKICLSTAIGKIQEKEDDIEIVGIGITNQRETTVIWDKETGIPYHHAIVWNDTRTSDLCDHLINDKFHGDLNYLRSKTGLPIASYFSATKILSLLDTIPQLRKDAESGKGLFGTIDTWLIWKLTNGKMHVTDVTNASRTLLMNLKTLTWDEEICKELNIPMSLLPTIQPSCGDFGTVDTSSADGGKSEGKQSAESSKDTEHYSKYQNVPIAGILGDQQAALFGQLCFNRGDTKCTYGTGAFLLMNTGNEIIESSNGLLTTVAYQFSNTNDKTKSLDNRPVYALEGSIAYSGSVIQWLRDNLEMISSAKDTEELANSIPDNGGVYFVPAFAGLYAPYWRDDARGVIAGLTAFHTKAHIVRAALEASAFQTIEIINAMNLDSQSKVPIKALKVDGGSTANNLLMQFQADLLEIPLIKPKDTETTALGAAFIAGLGVGLWSSLDDIKGLWQQDKQWKPTMPKNLRSKYIHHWKKAVGRSLYWKDNSQFEEQSGELITSAKDYVADPIAKLIEMKEDNDVHFISVESKSTMERKYENKESLKEIATAEKNKAAKDSKTASSSSSAATASKGEEKKEKKPRHLQLGEERTAADGKKIVINLHKQSKSQTGFLMFLVVGGFTLGIVITKLFPNRLPAIFAVAIGLLLLIFTVFKFEVEFEV